MLKIQRGHTPRFPWEGLCQGTEKESDSVVELQIQEEQCRFRPGRATVDQLFILPKIFEGAWEFCPTRLHVVRFVCASVVCGVWPFATNHSLPMQLLKRPKIIPDLNFFFFCRGCDSVGFVM